MYVLRESKIPFVVKATPRNLDSFQIGVNTLHPSTSKGNGLSYGGKTPHSPPLHQEDELAFSHRPGFRGFGPLAPDHLQVLLEEDPGFLKRVWKKTRRKPKSQLKDYIKGDVNQVQDDDEEKEGQLYELYHLQNQLEESKDEIHDAEILRSVYTSVLAHQKSWVKRLLNKLMKRHRVKRDEEMVCYKELGCFRDEGPFDVFDTLPNSPEEVNTMFLLHTKENPTREQYLSYNNASTFRNSNFLPTRKTKVIIHGFGSSCFRVWVREMRDTFLKMEDVNVICVQWEDGAMTPNYVRAASNSRLVGAQVALFLKLAHQVTNMSLDDVHLVGFSLGAHVSGYAGQRLEGSVGRISGLDPAGPLFESFPPNMRLDASDAKFVDVIHTNADSLFWGGLGAYDPMGHVDYYPNGGRVQKGCKNLFVGGVSDILWPKKGDGRYLCNHRRGYKYFMQSVIPVCKFPAFPCKDYETFLKGDCFPCKECGNMGYYADQSPGRGQMFLVTRDTEPFCANQFKVEIWHSGGPPSTDPVSTQGRFDIMFVASDGKNETIDVTRETGKKMHAGSRTVSIVVLHVALSVIYNLQVTYGSIRGWLSSGFNRWAIDKLSIMSSSGNIQSFCHRGLTMESGLAMVFPLVPGDCNPRELTLHPFPVPWPGIEYSIQNGVQILPSSNSKQSLGPNPTNFTTSGSSFQTAPLHISHRPHPPQIRTHVVQPPKAISPPPSRPTESSTTFSVIHVSLVHHNSTSIQRDTHPNPSRTRLSHVPNFHSEDVMIHNTTHDEAATLLDPMTEEEYIAWIKAPPPNLHPSQHSIIAQEQRTENIPPIIVSKMQSVNVIPAPRLEKTKSAMENTENTESKFSHTTSTPTKVSAQKLDTSGGKPLKKVNSDISELDFAQKIHLTKTKEDIPIPNRLPISIVNYTNLSGDQSRKLHTRLDTDSQSTPGLQKYIVNTPEGVKVLLDYQHPSLFIKQNGSVIAWEKANADMAFVSLSKSDELLGAEKPTFLREENDDLNSKNIGEDLSYNGVVLGEVPPKEKARAIKFNTPLNIYFDSVNEKDTIENYQGTSIMESSLPNRGDMEASSQPHTFNEAQHSEDLEPHGKNTQKPSLVAEADTLSHSLRRPTNLDNHGGSNSLTYKHYSFTPPHSFKPPNSQGFHHMLPPTLLKPPSIKTKDENSLKTSSPFHNSPSRHPLPPFVETQYSDLYAQHRYYPRPPNGPPPFDEGQGNKDEGESESSFFRFYETRGPVYIPGRETTPSTSVFQSQLPTLHFKPTFTSQSKGSKRPFNPLASFLSSFRQSKEERSKNIPKALFLSQNAGPPSTKPSVHPERHPYFVLPSTSKVPHYRSLSLPTHLRAPPPNKLLTNAGHRRMGSILPISRVDIGRRNSDPMIIRAKKESEGKRLGEQREIERGDDETLGEERRENFPYKGSFSKRRSSTEFKIREAPTPSTYGRAPRTLAKAKTSFISLNKKSRISQRRNG